MSQESISVILPVYNRQETLARRLERLLDDLSELTPVVQVLVVDDGSTDATPEILEELRCRYPQIEVLRHARPVGPSAAAQRCLNAAQGDFVFVQESYEPIDIEDVKHLWQLRSDRSLVMARARTRSRRIDESLLQKLHVWGQKLDGSWIGKSQPATELQMYKRDVVASLAHGDTRACDMEIAHYSHRRVASPKLNAPSGTPQGAEASQDAPKNFR